ncbi:MAG: M48 family metalloprotease [Bacteroidota bacterium]|nr:M48 family metalloprotease [Bacteroidota bacterium]
MRSNLKNLVFLRIIIAVTFLFYISSCGRNPVTGKKELQLMSESQEKALGLQSDPQILSEFGLYPDATLQAFIQAKGDSMAKISHRPNLGFQFKVLDSDVINAFAVPGGYVYFTRGIMAHFNNEAQLMGVLGHEIGHVTAKHANEQYTKQTLAQIGLIAGMIFSPQFRQFGDIANTGMQLLFLKFSRDNETQSDQLGVEYSSKVGYDAHHMADFFKTLSRVSEKAGASIPSFLSTHPDPGDRFNKVNAKATEMQKTFPKATKVERNSYLKKLDGMVYGEDPRQGYKENNMFYHPELKFQFPTPADWAYQNSPSKVQFGSKDKKALMFLSLSEEKTLDAAARAVNTNYKLQSVRQDYKSINGLEAIYMLGDLPPEQAATVQEKEANTMRVTTTLIQYNNLIYRIHGIATKPTHAKYESTFLNTMNGFRVLSDQSKINVQPDRIAIQEVKKSLSLSDALTSLNQDSKRFDELALLNGMDIKQKIEPGTLLKTISKNNKSTKP